jgi:hypothetical protein
MVVSHPSTLLKKAEGNFEGATSRLAQVMTSEDDMELEAISGDLGELLINDEKEISWITGNLTISF